MSGGAAVLPELALAREHAGAVGAGPLLLRAGRGRLGAAGEGRADEASSSKHADAERHPALADSVGS